MAHASLGLSAISRKRPPQVLWYGVRLVLTGRLTSGALLVFVIYLGKMYKPMKNLSKMADTLSKAAISFERIRDVLGVESDVVDRPGARPAPPCQGYETILGERGDTLSGGQRQRIAIARAIIRNAPILLLDEPSAALDPESEQLTFEGLSTLLAGRTSITIAHRLATVLNADIIFVLDHGVIAEQGNHAELMAKGGLYSRLYRIQFDQAGAQRPPVLGAA